MERHKGVRPHEGTWGDEISWGRGGETRFHEEVGDEHSREVTFCGETSSYWRDEVLLGDTGRCGEMNESHGET